MSVALLGGGAVRTAGAAPATSAVTFARDVAPILFSRCVGCHRPGGSAPFTLLTYASARQHARQIADVTRRRVMPPWKIRPGSNAFVGKEPLSATELATLEAWASADAPLGDTGDLPRAPDVESLGPSDLIVRAERPYALAAAGGDVFTTFVIHNPLRERRYVKSLLFTPTNPAAVHHADILLDQTTRSRRMVDDDTHSDGLLPRSAQGPPGYFLGWSPGQADARLPADLAWLLEPGSDFVVQLHLVPTGKPEIVSFSLALDFVDRPPQREPVMLRLSRQDLQLPAGGRDTVITDAYVLPVAVDVLAIRPHAHTRARVMSGTAELPDGTTRSLVAIDDWDFRWQQTYTYVTPIALPKGTRLTMRYSYDNSPANPRAPSSDRAIHWGPNSTDEMGDLWVQVLPRSSDDGDALVRNFRPKALMDNAAGYETLLRAGDDTAAIREDLAATYVELGLYDRAVPHLQDLAARAPRSAAAHYNAGVALAQAGRPADAVGEYQAALGLDATLVAAHFNLAVALERLDRSDGALAEYGAALELDPALAAADNNIGSILLNRRRYDEAIFRFAAALRLDPRLPDGSYNMGVALSATGRSDEALPYLRQAVELRPDWTAALQALSWLLSTGPDSNEQSAAWAIDLARRAISVAGQSDPHAADVLAAACAAGGDFDQAIRVLNEALARDVSPEIRTMLGERLRLYADHSRYRRP